MQPAAARPKPFHWTIERDRHQRALARKKQVAGWCIRGHVVDCQNRRTSGVSSEPRYTPSRSVYLKKNRKRRPSGKNSGSRGLPVPAPLTAVGYHRGRHAHELPVWKPSYGAKSMVPFGLQLPPNARGASASTSGFPPSRSRRFSFPSAKKPIERLSGAQNGKLAPSVPASG